MRVFGDNVTNLNTSNIQPKSEKSRIFQINHDPEIRIIIDETNYGLLKLKHNEVQYNLTMNSQQLNLREKLFKWVIAQCRLTLELRNATVEHCVRLYDKYINYIQECPKSLKEGQLILIACLFISSKYEQIYPPALSDFEYIGKYNFQAREILIKEREILQALNFELAVSLASEWYYVLFNCSMPQWAFLCYPSLYPSVSSKDLAWAVRKIDIPRIQDNNPSMNNEQLVDQNDLTKSPKKCVQHKIEQVLYILQPCIK